MRKLALLLTALTLHITLHTLHPGDVQGQMVCSPTAGTSCVNMSVRSRVAWPFGNVSTALATAAPTLNTCSCFLGNLPSMLTFTGVSYGVSAADADDVCRLAVYNYVGFRVYGNVGLAVTATGMQRLSSPIPGPFPAGDYWFCVACDQVGGTSTAQFYSIASASTGRNTAKATPACSAGSPPASFTPSITWGLQIPFFLGITDEQ